MKLFYLLLPVFFLGNALADNLPWIHDYAQAKDLARKENKHILLVFSGSDWCRNCMLLDLEVFNDQEFQTFARERLVLLKADFPRKKKNQLPEAQKLHNQDLASKYNPNGEFPKVLLLDAQQRVIYTTGYGTGYKDRFLKDLATKLSP